MSEFREQWTKPVESREVRGKKAVKQATLVALVGLAAISCSEGQRDTPTPNDINQKIVYYELDDVRTPNGDKVKCFMYADASQGTNNSKSWIVTGCDFAGVASFPPIPPTGPEGTTMLTPSVPPSVPAPITTTSSSFASTRPI